MFNKILDYTNLKVVATSQDIIKLCKEAIVANCFSVCVAPYYVGLAKEQLKNSNVLVCTVVGFPNGYSVAEVKYNETVAAINDGADEIDIVINIAAVKSGDYEYVKDEIFMLTQTCKKNKVVLKVIIETCLLTKDEIVKVCNIIKEVGTHFVKTSTGFSIGGATVEDIKLIKSVVKNSVKIKASGGIKTVEFAKQLVDAGADRLGSSTIL